MLTSARSAAARAWARRAVDDSTAMTRAPLGEPWRSPPIRPAAEVQHPLALERSDEPEDRVVVEVRAELHEIGGDVGAVGIADRAGGRPAPRRPRTRAGRVPRFPADGWRRALGRSGARWTVRMGSRSEVCPSPIGGSWTHASCADSVGADRYPAVRAVPATGDSGPTGLYAGQRRLPLRPTSAPPPVPLRRADAGRRVRCPAELLRIGHNCSQRATAPCPVCAESELRIVRFVFGARMPAGGRVVGPEGRDAQGGGERPGGSGATRSRCASRAGGTTCCRSRPSVCPARHLTIRSTCGQPRGRSARAVASEFAGAEQRR